MCGGVSVAGESVGKRFCPFVSEVAGAGMAVTVTCRVVKFSRQPYDRWLWCLVTESDVVEVYRANALFDAHRDDSEFGYRLLAGEARDAGEVMSDRTAWRIAPATAGSVRSGRSGAGAAGNRAHWSMTICARSRTSTPIEDPHFEAGNSCAR